jgi:hypothetical protein
MSDLILDDDQMCFCCGPKNPIGLKLRFENLEDGRTRTVWRPRQEHQGFKDIVHGGLVATVLDEVMIRMLYHRGIPAVTGTMETKLLKPSARAATTGSRHGWSRTAAVPCSPKRRHSMPFLESGSRGARRRASGYEGAPCVRV